MKFWCGVGAGGRGFKSRIPDQTIFTQKIFAHHNVSGQVFDSAARQAPMLWHGGIQSAIALRARERSEHT